MTTNNSPTCQELFSDEGLAGASLQDAVHLHYPAGECQSVSVSKFSSGFVDDGETLTRLIIHPIHVENGTVTPLAFNDATTLDLSVFREEQATDSEIQLAIDEIRALGETKVPPQNRIVEMVMQASATAVRSALFVVNEVEYPFRVYDTGTEDKPAHASVFTPSVARKGSGQRQARKVLWRLFSEQPVHSENYRRLNYSGN